MASGEIQSLMRAIAILDCFRADQPQLGVREIARQLTMSTSTVGRLLATLYSAGILSQDPTTRLYRMGPKVLAWGALYTSLLDVREFARPSLEELHRITNETVSLYVLERTERVCVERIESPERVRVVVRIGERMPLHAGSAGKALLAFMPADDIEQIVAQPLERMTERTITNRRALLKELKTIRECGFATSHGERFEDALGLAAPIFDSNGKVTAALNVAGPLLRFTDQHVERFAPKIVLLANQVSRALGYPGSSQIPGGKE
ncbi:MAG: IclR family transcriptional regulator [Chloroflexi bacterium]|nr:IclR family transcriptional regulator [Chloroflexota bacterium]